jgi:hypothetical protein
MSPKLRAFPALLVTLSAAPAFAGDFHADYSAPEGCPTRAEFVRAIEQRVPDWHHVDGAVERKLALEVRRTDTGFAGRLTLAAGVRDVEGAECETVVRALALVAAVSLDPAAAEREAAAPAPVPGPALAPVPAPAPEPARPPPVAGPEVSFGFGAAAGLLFGPAPSVLYGGAVHAELGDLERRFLLRVAGMRLVTGSVSVGGAEASFGLTAAELGGCYRLLQGGSLALSGCLVSTAGALTAAGEPGPELARTEDSSRFWGSTGARFGVFARPVPALELGAELGGSVAWFEHSYVFENPTNVIHTTSLLGADLRLGLTIVLP